MAEEDENGQEKTHDATPKRLEELREQGQVPRSRELNMLLLLVTSLTMLSMLGPAMMKTLTHIMETAFGADREVLMDYSLILVMFKEFSKLAMLMVLPFFLTLFVVTIATPILLGGFIFSMKAIGFKMSRLDPIAGIMRMFSLQTVFSFIKPLAKFFFVLTLGGIFYWIKFGEMMALDNMALPVAVVKGMKLLTYVIIGPLCGVLFIVAIDVPFQWWQYQKKLKMTTEEIKKEMKETEGSPEAKGRQRQMQREISKRRMMADVPKANVVVTNPTHFAVALRYDDSKEGAPIVVAKGADLVAQKIREIATENNVTLFAAPLLARSLYYKAEIGKEIPAGLYLAVAKVLAYVYQLKRYDAGYAPRPHELKDTEIVVPDELKPDESLINEVSTDETP